MLALDADPSRRIVILRSVRTAVIVGEIHRQFIRDSSGRDPVHVGDAVESSPAACVLCHAKAPSPRRIAIALNGVTDTSRSRGGPFKSQAGTRPRDSSKLTL